MKKILSALVAITLVFSLFCFTVSAEGENKLEGVEWTKGYCKSIESREEDGTKIYTAKYSDAGGDAWTSPTIPVLNAVKELMGEEEEIDLTLVFSIRALPLDGASEISTSCRVLVRGESDIKDKETFDEKYGEALDGSDALFTMSGTNIQKGGKTYTISSSEWTTIEFNIEALENIQVNDGVITGWNLCVDMIKESKNMAGVEVKNAGAYLTEDYAGEDEEEKPTAKPTVKPADGTTTVTEETVVGTQVPAATGQPAATETESVVETKTSGININVILYIVAGVLVVASVVAVVVVTVKKPKAKENTEATESTEAKPEE